MNGLQHPLAWWQATTFIPNIGQVCQVLDYPIYKVGDGNNTWNNLQAIYNTPICSWFTKWYPIKSIGSILTQLDKTNLLGGSFIQEGNWVEFQYIILPSNNSNVKNAYIKFITTTLLSISIPINSAVPIAIKGKIKCLNFTTGTLQYKIALEGTTPTIGTITGINWAVDNALYLQAVGVADSDILSGGGDGKICIIARK